MDGTSLDTLLKEDPAFCFTNLQKIRTFQSMLQNRSLIVPSKPTIVNTNNESELASPVVSWYNENLLCQREFKQEQLWLWGPPSVGKTTFVMMLDDLVKLMLAPTEEEYWCNYDDSYDLVVFDEFKGQKTISFMNAFVQGWKVHLKRKLVGAYVKKKNVPVIVLSNYSIVDCYSKAEVAHPGCTDPLHKRFKEVYWPVLVLLAPLVEESKSGLE